jgi:hypothetical protein
MPDDATSSLPQARIEHRISGRVRLRINAKRGDSSFFQHAKAVLAAQPDICDVTTNPRTGSILIEHRGSEASILATARKKALFDSAVPSPPATAGRRPGKTPASPLDLAAAGLAAAGVVQLARGQVVGSASENLWNAHGLYMANKGSWAPALLVGFGIMQIMRGQVLGSATSLFLYAFSARKLAQRRSVAGTA